VIGEDFEVIFVSVLGYIDVARNKVDFNFGGEHNVENR